MRTIRFVGSITTQTPVAIALPDMTGLPKTGMGVPYAPASSIRGWMRHNAHYAVAELLSRHNKTLSVDQHYMLSSGVDTGRAVKDLAGSVKVANNLKIRSANPVVSLFGRWGLGSNLKVSNAVAPSADCLVIAGGGARNHAFNRNNSLIDFVNQDELERLQSIMKEDGETAGEAGVHKKEILALKRAFRSATAESKAEINQKIAALEDKINEIKTNRVGAKESILRPIEGFEAIDENTELSHRMILNNSSDLELLFFIWVLYKCSVSATIGGHGNVGCGEIHCNWDVTTSSFENPKRINIGNVKIDDDGFSCTVPFKDGVLTLGADTDTDAAMALIESMIVSEAFDLSVFA